MKTFQALLSALLLAAAMPAAAQQTRLLTPDRYNDYGLVYSLPVTELRVSVTATRTLRQAGPYYQYAKKFLGTDDVVTADAEIWTIDNVTVTPYGVADPDEKYLMQLKPGSTTYIGVASDGMLLSINARPVQPEAPAPKPKRIAQKPFTGREYLKFVDEDFTASQSKASQAQLLSESLMEVRDARISLTRGTADQMPTDGRQLELMLNSLAEQEDALTAAFAGRESKVTVTREFTFRPEKEGRSVLFRLSDFGGFTDADDYSGAPVYITIDNIRDAEFPRDEKGNEKKMPKDAVVYALPGTARVTLSFDGATLWSDDLGMSQFGAVFGLNPSLFSSKKEPAYAIFDPATGALRELGAAQSQPLPEPQQEEPEE